MTKKTDIYLTIAEKITRFLDDGFSFFGFKIGMDPIIGLIPGIGDFISLGLGLYIVWIGRNAGLPGEKIRLMIGNLILDFVLGLVPVVGDVGDLFFKANRRNLNIIKSFKNKIKEDIEEGEIIG